MRTGSDIRKRRPGATARARRLRRDETDAEYRLWYRLRGREIGSYKFLRQVPLGPYVVDFLCRSKRLVVEIDGGQHANSESDPRRTEWLNRHGYSVLRFWNHEALREREAVLDAILAVLEGRIVAPSPGLRFAPATLSPWGEERRPAARWSRSSKRHGVKEVARRRSSFLFPSGRGRRAAAGEGDRT